MIKVNNIFEERLTDKLNLKNRYELDRSMIKFKNIYILDFSYYKLYFVDLYQNFNRFNFFIFDSYYSRVFEHVIDFDKDRIVRKLYYGNNK